MSSKQEAAESSTDSNNNNDNANEVVEVGSIDEANEWVDVEVNVRELWSPNTDSIAQVGLLEDDSGTVKFVAWQKSNLPEMAEGESYALSNVVTDEYEGNFSVNLNRNSEIEALDDEVVSGDGDNEADEDESESEAEAVDEGDDEDLVACDDIDSEGEWLDVEAEVSQLWEPNTDSIAQVGLLEDDSGTVKFTAWEKSDLPEVEEGASYRFSNVVTSEYEGQYSLSVNGNSEIEAVEN